MTVRLFAEDLDALHSYISALNTATKYNQVKGCADSPDHVSMDAWPHSLPIGRVDDPESGSRYYLEVES